MACRGDSCGTVDIDSNIPLLREQRLTRMDADAHANRPRLECPLGLSGRFERATCGRERKEERVALRVHFHAAMRAERFAQQPAMFCHRLGVCARTQPT